MMRKATRLSLWLLPLFWMGVLHYLLTTEVDPDQVSWLPPYADKVVHFGIFAILAWLWLGPLHISLSLSLPVAVSLGFGLAVSYGIWTEYLQSTLPHREGDVADLVANTLGALTVGLALVLRRQAMYGRLMEKLRS